MLDRITYSKSKTFFAFCFSFLLGVGIISLIDKPFKFLYLYISLFILVTLSIISWHRKTIRFILLCVFCILLGIARYTIAFPPHSPSHISYYNGTEKKFTAYVSREPDVREDGVRYIIQIINPKSEIINPEKNNTMKGKVYIKSALYPRYRY